MNDIVWWEYHKKGNKLNDIWLRKTTIKFFHVGYTYIFVVDQDSQEWVNEEEKCEIITQNAIKHSFVVEAT